VPDITLACVEFIRQTAPQNNITISIELEKPERTDLSDIVPHADVVFYSKLWATSNGFNSAREFLEAQLPTTREGHVHSLFMTEAFVYYYQLYYG
jgi:ketohexokinase